MARRRQNTGDEAADDKKPHGVQSAETAIKVLKAFLTSDGPMPLAEIASAAEMAPSNVYRYLVTFCESGLAAQEQSSGFYDLGPLAAQLGFSALSRIDGVGIASTKLRELVELTRTDGHVSVWGSAGATVVRWRSQRERVSLFVREGTVLPLLTSATGRLWASFLPEPVVGLALGRELLALSTASGTTVPQLRAQYTAMFEQIRQSRLSFSAGEQNRGIDALAAPIFDDSGEIAFSFTLLGSTGSFQTRSEHPVAQALLGATAEVSRRLGADPHFNRERLRTIEPKHARRGRPKTLAPK